MVDHAHTVLRTFRAKSEYNLGAPARLPDNLPVAASIYYDLLTMVKIQSNRLLICTCHFITSGGSMVSE